MIAQHLLQNFSPGLIGFPQDRQSRSGCSCAGAEVSGAMGGDGGGKIVPVFVSVAGEGAGEITVPHAPQNFISRLIGVPHDGQVNTTSGGDGSNGTAAMVSPIFPPQFPQNFISGLIGVPHDGQVTATGGGNGTAGTAGMVSPIFPPQFPQNFSSGSQVFPHERQVRGAVFGSSGGVGMVTGGNTSPSAAPQCRQNFAFGTLLCPHSGQ